MPKEDERILKDANKHRESGKSCRASVHERNGDKQIVSDVDKDKELLMAAGTGKLNELTFTGDFENARLDKEQDLALEWGKMKEGNRDAILREVNDSRVTKDEISQINYLRSDAGMLQLSEEADEKEPIVMNRRQVEWDSESNSPIQESHSKVLDQTCYIEKEGATEVAGNVDNPHTLEKGQETVYCEGDVELKSQTNCNANESDAGIIDPLVKVKFNNFSKSKDDSQDESICFVTNNTAESLSLLEQLKDSSTGRIGRKAVCIMPENIPTPLGYSYKIDKNVPTDDNQEQMMKRTEVIIEEVKTRDSFTSCQVVNGSKVKDASSVPECNKDQQYSSKNALNQSIVQKDKIMKENLVAKDQKVVDRIRRDIELENERLRKIEEEWEREREREKDRMAVDKAALEAYEKSHIEAREKAERAAVERATAEVRQRTMAVARERLEKSSMEARHRAERAAVERATAEARQRAVERSMAEKAASERVERTISDGFSVLSRSADTKQSFVSSDIQFQVTGISSGCRHSYFPAHVGAEGESPQRCKARLERYRRTAERAANALAEKNKRDLLAQKEREERNRVAETLEAEVKRWSRGKEGNLRALLSTLQYILGPNSGWQPVPLTEVITSAAVKKAYRKATLCVHPDKLQQRGATIQQKYTCEKVFDLLKEAWNKFNSEER